ALQLPTDRQTGAQDEVVLELLAAIEITAVEEVFSLEPQTDRCRERNADTEAQHATPIRAAFAFLGDVVTDTNERRTAAKEDSHARLCRGQTQHQLGATHKHLGIAISVHGGAGDLHVGRCKPTGELESDRTLAPEGETRSHDEAVVALDVCADGAERILGRDIGARPRGEGAALRGRGRYAHR